MTLAAAFFVGDHPFVLADMLISGEDFKGLSLPSVGRVAELPNAPRDASGLVQKVSIVASNFAVAYAGSLIPAEVVVKALEREAKESELDEVTLKEFFQSKRPLLQRVALVGVLATRLEDKVFALKTVCIGGSRFETAGFGEVAAIGKGTPLLRQVLSSWSGSPFEGIAPITSAVGGAMAVAGTLHSLENNCGDALQDFASGGAYDIVVFVDGKFRRLPRHRYVIWHAVFEHDKINLRVPHLVLTQEYVNGIAHIHCARLSTDFSHPKPRYHVETHVVPPRWTTVYEVQNLKQDFQAIVTVHVVRVVHGPNSELLYFLDSEHQSITVETKDENVSLVFSMQAIDSMREQIRAACQAQQSPR